MKYPNEIPQVFNEISKWDPQWKSLDTQMKNPMKSQQEIHEKWAGGLMKYIITLAYKLWKPHATKWMKKIGDPNEKPFHNSMAPQQVAQWHLS